MRKSYFKEGELLQECNLHYLQIAGSDKPIALYSLDVIISVGYRVKSQRGTEFRVWANKSFITVVDNYADDSLLAQLTKRNKNVSATVCVGHLSEGLRYDLERHNRQYAPIEIRITPGFHDRFLLIDGIRLYHFGASFKDLGRKLFCFTLIESEVLLEVVRALAQGVGEKVESVDS